MASKIQLRRDVKENWEFVNPVLSQGEPGLQIAENLIKIGDGVTTVSYTHLTLPTTERV